MHAGTDMNQNTIVLLLLLGYAAAVSNTCSLPGPENCNFDNSRDKYCSWTEFRFYRFFTGDSYHIRKPYAAGLRRWQDNGQLISSATCPTGMDARCLDFNYYFEKDDIIDLSVSLLYSGSKTVVPEPPIWTTSGIYTSYGWKKARVPIKANAPFQIVFTAKRRSAHSFMNYTVVIDDIKYRFRATCDIMPSTAKPPTPLPTTSTTQQTTATTTTPSITTNTDEGNQITSVQPVPADDGETSSKQPNKLHTVVGVVVAVVVVVVVIAVALIVLFRRKEQTKAERVEADASQAVPYSLVAGEPLYDSCPQLHTANEDTRKPTETDTSDYYSAIGNPDEPPPLLNDSTMPPLYARVNKSRSKPNLPNSPITRNADVPKTPGHSGMPVYAKVNKSPKPRQTEEIPLDNLNTNDSVYEIVDEEIDRSSSSTDKSRKCRDRPVEAPALDTNANDSIYEIPDDEADTLQNCGHEELPPNFPNGNKPASTRPIPNDEAHSSYTNQSQNCRRTEAPPNSDGEDSIYAIPDDESENIYVNNDVRQVQRFRQAPVESANSSSALSPSADDRVYYILEKEDEEEEDISEIYPVPGDVGAAAPPTGPDQKEEHYNMLDFDASRRRPLHQTDGAVGRDSDNSGAGADSVYSRLGEGDEGTYNRMDRNTRPGQVIDGDYSHIM